jgi:L-asparaginase
MMNLRCCGLRIAAVLIVAIGGTALNQAISANQDLRVCHMIATGGTIAMKIDPVKNAPVPALSGEDLVAGVPELAKVAKVRVESLFNMPSDHMTTEHWMAIRKSVLKALSGDEVSGVIISHGTDTLEETAYFLDLTVRSDKPIILVGAQRNASDRDFDGPRNLVNASRICVSETALGKGAMIVLNGQINAAREATKTHTSDVESFKSGDFGFLGVVDHDRVVFTRSPMRRQHVPVTGDALPRVDIVPLYAGADAALFCAAIAAGAKGVVLQAFGWGNINVPLYEAMQEAIAKGIVVVISTRVPNGRVLPIYGFKGGGKTLKEAGAVFADNLSPHKARILSSLNI